VEFGFDEGDVVGVLPLVAEDEAFHAVVVEEVGEEADGEDAVEHHTKHVLLDCEVLLLLEDLAGFADEFTQAGDVILALGHLSG
jgi:hypothetical protein